MLFSLAGAALFGQTIQIIDNPNASLSEKVALMGSIGNPLESYQLINRSSGNSSISDLTVVDETISEAGFRNLQLWDGGTSVAAAGAPLAVIDAFGKIRGWSYSLHFASPIIVPAMNTVTLALRGDVASYASGVTQDNSIHQFQMIESGANFSASAYGGPVRILHSNLSFGFSSAGLSGQLVFAAAPSGPVTLKKLAITFADEWQTPAFSSPDNIFLLDQNGNDVVIAGEAIRIVNDSKITWLFTSGFVIAAGTQAVFDLKPMIPIRSWIASPTDIVFTDGVDRNAISGLSPNPIGLPAIITGRK